ncbi:glycosyltransferase family 4 protein [Rahnella sp. SL6]|uniref:Glycosyltransferase family 4 protein n=2 Tax=Rahnella perminowiae TaxID=2816244 RepID=A0ABS6L896_9GAMM|nr:MULTISPECIES: glycosyltransferase family 4 protein [Rahnella]MBU9808557.1 glycosyltransferase family 4 protein [Rahnella perminowiae]MBU9838077.1 glycosyltransferase family 4 protein [Rahnella perminowiae]UJD90752.1 glycosyltransferase family 4 protein [Rahnella aquatilis]
MKMVFAHDHYFIHHGEKVYSPGKLPYSAFTRYLHHFDQVTVLSRYKNDSSFSPYWTLASGHGMVFKKIENHSSLKSVLFTCHKNIIEIKDTLRGCDGVVVRLPSETGLITAKIARQMNIPYLVELVACPWDAMIGYGSLKGFLYAPVLSWRVRQAVKKAWGAIYVTGSFLQKRYPIKYNGVSASNVDLLPASLSVLNQRCDKIATSSGGPFKIGLIASLDSPHKGFDTIYKAVYRLKNKGVPVILEITGGGSKFKNSPLIDKLLLHDNIIFSGPKTSGEGIFSFLDTVDLYVQPSNQEGLPRAVIEAMSRACPVITSSAGGMPELCQRHYLHKPNDDHTLANNIEYLLKNRQEMLSMAHHSFNTARLYQPELLMKIRFDLFTRYKNHMLSLRNA